eukprot:CAMPEP_0202897888 /NCGR_PEP_ID=MMETSP1392-20130828/6541_1 /ASSEMBLY_ACC=CAM_ASM_000868 /TAXON_ID=225041 /ORGANISM="Chlamydomonas chlamydogama, Strain SAG 11-48b" /LENGTH=294 /DNA_ID=CAMNT_0049583653 /DNA_START=176 /DNA_END=1058 /DNA_ORIENTATION=+
MTFELESRTGDDGMTVLLSTPYSMAAAPYQWSVCSGFRSNVLPSTGHALEPRDEEVLSTLSSCFHDFMELTSSDSCWEAGRKPLQDLEQRWQSRGLHGRQFLQLLTMYRTQIGWEAMVPDHFNKFYRFVFYISKEPQRKHLQIETAIAAWQLVLAGRFRLLSAWCDFLWQKHSTVRVINEDQWRQVLDFSRTVHEDLSNFDPNGAWAWILDDFVEHTRSQRLGIGRQPSSSLDLAAMQQDSGPSHMIAISPHVGSKRRSADVDVVAEQLSAMPLTSSSSDELTMSAAKRLCSMG